MALTSPGNLHLQSANLNFILFQVSSFLLLLVPPAISLDFNFPSFNYSVWNVSIVTVEDAQVANGIIQLTRDLQEKRSDNSQGRVYYNAPVQLWDNKTGILTNFTTKFSFTIRRPVAYEQNSYGDGITFFLARYGSAIPRFSQGGGLGVFYTPDGSYTSANNPNIVAVEFDTFKNTWDPNYSHLGIDLNSIISVQNISCNGSFWDWMRENGHPWEASVGYDSSSQYLSVVLACADKSLSYCETCSLYYPVDLKKYLPEQVTVGFSASTGACYELHALNYWDFSSSLETDDNNGSSAHNQFHHPPYTAAPPTINPTASQTDDNNGSSAHNQFHHPPYTAAPPTINPTASQTDDNNGSSAHNQFHHPPYTAAPSTINRTNGYSTGFLLSKKMLMVLGGAAPMIILVYVGLVLFFRQRRKNIESQADHDVVLDVPTGPREFSYAELAGATSNFDEKQKLGGGGFGGVYRGFLNINPTTKVDVAVKRISKGSRQGTTEYASEVKIISRLRHRNLVQLYGWCHQPKELLLVYQFMPNESLDFHLFGNRGSFTWELRYKIALDLASALQYLHEGWEQCVLHRDIKSSNIILDSKFDAKLGDFGLARLVDHEKGSQTTNAAAGTMGYMAPEYLFTGMASKETDIYSFGILLLEIVCGRKPVEIMANPREIILVGWVSELYERQKHLEAVDPSQAVDSDQKQLIEHMIIVGLWCAQHDYNLRPSIGQAIHVLNFDAPLPFLPYTAHACCPSDSTKLNMSTAAASIFFGGIPQVECMGSKIIEYMIIVGLLCAQQDYNLRPSIGQAIHDLNFDAPLPFLPYSAHACCPSVSTKLNMSSAAASSLAASLMQNAWEAKL